MHRRSDPTSSSPRRQQWLVSPRALDYSGAAVISLYMGRRGGVILDNTQYIRCSFPQTHMQAMQPVRLRGNFSLHVPLVCMSPCNCNMARRHYRKGNKCEWIHELPLQITHFKIPLQDSHLYYAVAVSSNGWWCNHRDLFEFNNCSKQLLYSRWSKWETWDRVWSISFYAR